MSETVIIIITVTISFIIALAVGSALYARQKNSLAIMCMAIIIVAGPLIGVLVANRVGMEGNNKEKDKESVTESDFDIPEFNGKETLICDGCGELIFADDIACGKCKKIIVSEGRE